VAAAVGLATLAVAAPALGQADPGATSTTAGGEPSTTTVAESSTTSTSTEGAGTTEATTTTIEPAPVPEGTPFPVALVAPVPPVEGDPDTAITDLYVTDGATPDEPDVVVQFREPFTFAGTPYRVGVVIGDPTGTRLRTWLISNGPGNLPYGRVERFEAGTWTELGATTVQFQDGLMILTVPIAEAPTGGAIWAEIVENDADAPSHTTPYFSRDALFGTADAGTVPSGVFGRVFGLDGISPDPVELPPGGTLVSIEDQIAITYPDPPPREVDGQAATSVVDLVRIAPDYDAGAVLANFVGFDRTTGEVGLYDGFAPTPIDKSGDRSWLISAPPPREAGVLVLDRAAIVRALGLPDDGAGIALGVSRSIELEDGRFVTADGVLATDDWLDLAPPSALPEVTTTTAPAAAAPASEPASETRLPLLVAAGVGLVLVLLVVILVRRRSARREEIADFAAAAGAGAKQDRMPWGSSDGDLIITTTHEFDALIPADATPLPAPKPVDESPVPATPAGSGVRILATPVAPAPDEDAADRPVAPDAAAPSEPTPAEPTPAEPTPAEPTPAAPTPAAAPVAAVGPSLLDAEPAWGTAAPPEAAAAAPAVGPAADPAPTPGPPPPTAPEAAPPDRAEVAPDRDDGADDEAAPAPPDPGRIDPMAALSALDQDMDELRRRVAGLGQE
jgi:hypothetical protein